jgi:hypothetical protein
MGDDDEDYRKKWRRRTGRREGKEKTTVNMGDGKIANGTGRQKSGLGMTKVRDQ